MENNQIIPVSQLGQKIVKKLFPDLGNKTALQKKLEESISPKKYKSIGALAAYVDALRVSSAANCKIAPPITNRGVSREELTDNDAFIWSNAFNSLETKQIKSIGSSRSIYVTIPQKDTSLDFSYSFIDYLNFTFKVSDFDYTGVSDDDVISSLSPVLHKIFGFGITEQRKNGLNFYQKSYDLGINGWGTVCIGGQKDTILVTLKGQGIMASKGSWSKSLYNFLKLIPSASITRVDLAHDSFQSKQSLDDYLTMYKSDMFTNRGQLPNVEFRGNWVNPNGKGRTLYIGSRSSGKLLRIYEKGLQLGRGYSELFKDWVRTELELRNDGRIIPLDVLQFPSQYLAGAYPALALFAQEQNYFETKKKSAQATVATAIEITKNQFGKYIWVIKELYGLERAFDMLTQGKEQPPSKLDLTDFSNYDPTFNISPKRAVTLQEIMI